MRWYDEFGLEMKTDGPPYAYENGFYVEKMKLQPGFPATHIEIAKWITIRHLKYDGHQTNYLIQALMSQTKLLHGNCLCRGFQRNAGG